MKGGRYDVVFTFRTGPSVGTDRRMRSAVVARIARAALPLRTTSSATSVAEHWFGSAVGSHQSRAVVRYRGGRKLRHESEDGPLVSILAAGLVNRTARQYGVGLVYLF